MDIVQKQVAELREYENNPRINDGAVAAVAESIERFGFKVPIVIDGGGVIIAGHTRKKAAERLGLASVPCVVADDLSPEQIKAFRLADNKTGDLADWDFSALEKELADLAAVDISMKEFGFFDFQNDYFDGIFEEPKKEDSPKSGEEKQPAENEQQEKGVYVLSIEFDDEADADDLIELLQSEGYEYTFERR